MVVNNARLPRSTAGLAQASLITGLFLVAAAAIPLMLASSAPWASGQITWGSIALTVFCLGLLFLMSGGSGADSLGLATWRLGPWSLVWAAFAFGLATISWLAPQTGPSAELLPSSILRALWLMAVAMAMFTAGYRAGPHRLAGVQVRRVAGLLTSRLAEEVRGPATPWALFGVGLVAQLGSAILTGRLGYVGDVAASVSTASGYSQYLGLAGQCVTLGVAAAAVRAYQARTAGTWFTLAVLFTAAIILGAASGNKTTFVVTILAVVVPRARTRRRLPAGIIIGAIAFFMLVITPFNLAYRATARSATAGGTVTLSTTQAIATAPTTAGQVLTSDLSLSGLGQSASVLAQRIRSIDSPAIIMQRTPAEIPYSNPADLITAPVVDLIPRIVWPGKPILATGYQMSQEYFQLPPQIYTASTISPEGDLYRHGGWIPLIIGSFLGGCGIRILDELTDLRRSVHGAFLIIVLFPNVVQGSSDLGTLLAGIPGMIVLWLAVITASFARRPAPPAGSLAPGAGQREGRPFVTECRCLDRVAHQPVTDPLAAIVRAGGGPGQGGGQGLDLTDREDLPDSPHQVWPGADRVADHGDEAAGHALVDDQSPLFMTARQGEDVTDAVPARQFTLIDEAEAAYRQAGRIAADLLPQRAVSQHQQVQPGVGMRDGADQIERPLVRDELPGEDHRRLSRVKPESGQPFPARWPGGIGHGPEALIIHTVRCREVGYAPITAVKRGVALPDRQGAGRAAHDGTRHQVPGQPAPAHRGGLRGRVTPQQVRHAQDTARPRRGQHARMSVTVQDDDVMAAQPATRRRQPRGVARQRLASQDGGAVSPEQVDVPRQRDPELRVVAGPDADVAQERDLEVHHATASELLIQGHLVLDRMGRQDPQAWPGLDHATDRVPLAVLILTRD
jgi:hypothetical protein